MADLDLDCNLMEYETCCQLLRDTVRNHQVMSYLHRYISAMDKTYSEVRAWGDAADVMFLRQLDIFANRWGKNLFFVVMNEVFPGLIMNQVDAEKFVEQAQKNVSLLRQYHCEKIIPLVYFSYMETGKEIPEHGEKFRTMDMNLLRSEKDLTPDHPPLDCDDIYSVFQLCKYWSGLKLASWEKRNKFGYETNYGLNCRIRYKNDLDRQFDAKVERIRNQNFQKNIVSSEDDDDEEYFEKCEI